MLIVIVLLTSIAAGIRLLKVGLVVVHRNIAAATATATRITSSVSAHATGHTRGLIIGIRSVHLSPLLVHGVHGVIVAIGRASRGIHIVLSSRVVRLRLGVVVHRGTSTISLALLARRLR